MSWGNPQTASEQMSQALLKPLAWPYKLALDLRQAAYNKNWIAAQRLSCPVVSVGNLTVGGSGKTPLIIDLARRLLADKIKVGILSRGYGRLTSRCIVVSNGRGNFASLSESGDEALLIAKTLPPVVMIVNQDRIAAGQKAIAEYGCEILLLDDGFQHWRLQRDHNIVLIDYADDPLRDALLPAGRLREPISALNRATHIVITKIPQDYVQSKVDYLKNLARTYGPGASISTCQFVNSSLEQFISGSWHTQNLDLLNDLPVVAFCGIAKPEGFFETLKNTGAHVLDQIAFSDHHYYSQNDLYKLSRALKENRAKYLVTTRKDLVKLGSCSLVESILAINQEIHWLETPPDIRSILPVKTIV